jgi:peptidoglycan/xylan/chitin deacetylase (PgdA/CDA1 family)
MEIPTNCSLAETLILARFINAYGKPLNKVLEICQLERMMAYMRKNHSAVYLVPLITTLFAATACSQNATTASTPVATRTSTTVFETTSATSSTTTSSSTTSTTTSTSSTTTTTSAPVSTTTLPPQTTTATPPPVATAPVATQVSSQRQPGRMCIAEGDRAKPQVALTVDDFERSYDTADLNRLLDVAKVLDVKLTLFPTGHALQIAIDRGEEAVWRRAVREGHVIGDHTVSHSNMRGMGLQRISDELGGQQALLNQVLGFDYPEILMRPPYGSGALGCNLLADFNASFINKSLGYTIAVWTIDGNGFSKDAPFREGIINSPKLKNGAIILLHPQTLNVENYEPLINGIRAHGLEMVTLNEMLGLSPCAPIDCSPHA